MTTVSVVLLAMIAAVVSYRHMHGLALARGETRWNAALIPVSVDEMIVASSMSILLDSRRGGRGGVLPWVLLIAGSGASLAANMAVAEPTAVGRVIAAWPAASLVGAFELLMAQLRQREKPADADACGVSQDSSPETSGLVVGPPGRALQREAWRWALDHHRAPGGRLPSGGVVAAAFGRSARWGRQVKQAGLAGALDMDGGS